MLDKAEFEIIHYTLGIDFFRLGEGELISVKRVIYKFGDNHQPIIPRIGEVFRILDGELLSEFEVKTVSHTLQESEESFQWLVHVEAVLKSVITEE